MSNFYFDKYQVANCIIIMGHCCVCVWGGGGGRYQAKLDLIELNKDMNNNYNCRCPHVLHT